MPMPALLVQAKICCPACRNLGYLFEGRPPRDGAEIKARAVPCDCEAGRVWRLELRLAAGCRCEEPNCPANAADSWGHMLVCRAHLAAALDQMGHTHTVPMAA